VRRVSWSVLILAALVAAGIGGFWIGRADLKLPRVMEAKGGPQAPSGPVIYYQDPDGKPIYSAEPKSTPDGRPYLAVHASEEVNFDDAAKSTAEPAG